jgi:hypothetical protein
MKISVFLVVEKEARKKVMEGQSSKDVRTWRK